jgi:hypothetical protein
MGTGVCMQHISKGQVVHSLNDLPLQTINDITYKYFIPSLEHGATQSALLMGLVRSRFSAVSEGLRRASVDLSGLFTWCDDLGTSVGQCLVSPGEM